MKWNNKNGDKLCEFPGDCICLKIWPKPCLNRRQNEQRALDRWPLYWSVMKCNTLTKTHITTFPLLLQPVGAAPEAFAVSYWHWSLVSVLCAWQGHDTVVCSIFNVIKPESSLPLTRLQRICLLAAWQSCSFDVLHMECEATFQKTLVLKYLDSSFHVSCSMSSFHICTEGSKSPGTCTLWILLEN